MAWIDYKKAYDMVPCLQIYKTSDVFRNFIEKTMKSGKVELTAGGEA